MNTNPSKFQPVKECAETVALIERKFAAMRFRMEQTRQKLADWIEANQVEQVQLCGLHGTERVIDWDKSTHTTMVDGMYRVVYVSCHMCERHGAIIRESQWLKDRGIPESLLHCTFDNFKTDALGAEEAKREAEKFVRVRRGFFPIVGAHKGIGKSHLAVAIMRDFGTGLFITNTALMAKLSEHYDDRNKPDILAICEQTKLLVLDDLGISRGGKDEKPALHRILTTRYERKRPTVITSNLSWEEIQRYVGDRMTDRFTESAWYIGELEGKSLRAERRKAYFSGSYGN